MVIICLICLTRYVLRLIFVSVMRKILTRYLYSVNVLCCGTLMWGYDIVDKCKERHEPGESIDCTFHSIPFFEQIDQVIKWRFQATIFQVLTVYSMEIKSIRSTSDVLNSTIHFKGTNHMTQL